MAIPRVLHSFAPTMLRRCVRNLRTILCVAIGTIQTCVRREVKKILFRLCSAAERDEKDA